MVKFLSMDRRRTDEDSCGRRRIGKTFHCSYVPSCVVATANRSICTRHLICINAPEKVPPTAPPGCCQMLSHFSPLRSNFEPGDTEAPWPTENLNSEGGGEGGASNWARRLPENNCDISLTFSQRYSGVAQRRRGRKRR